MNKKLLLVIVTILPILSVFGQTPKGIAENNLRVANFIHELSKKPYIKYRYCRTLALFPTL